MEVMAFELILLLKVRGKRNF